MKKYILLLISIILLTGCGKNKNINPIEDFYKKIDNLDSYKLDAKMQIFNNEDKYDYDVSVLYMKDDYYKVELNNKVNDHKQIILKNIDGVYVITPSLNKSFKFQSDWPYNSSQSYLLTSIQSDLKNEEELLKDVDGEYVVYTCDVLYPNNSELKYEKVYFDKNSNLKKVDVYNEDDMVRISVEFNSIDYKSSLSKNDFNIDNFIEEEISESTNSLEDIIYPLYIPNETYLSGKETISTDNGNRVILTFSGEKNFVLVEEASVINKEFEIIPVNGEPLMLSNTVGALSNNSLSWSNDNIDYYIASSDLSGQEMQTIAHSLIVSDVVVGK